MFVEMCESVKSLYRIVIVSDVVNVCLNVMLWCGCVVRFLLFLFVILWCFDDVKSVLLLFLCVWLVIVVFDVCGLFVLCVVVMRCDVCGCDEVWSDVRVLDLESSASRVSSLRKRCDGVWIIMLVLRRSVFLRMVWFCWVLCDVWWGVCGWWCCLKFWRDWRRRNRRWRRRSRWFWWCLFCCCIRIWWCWWW